MATASSPISYSVLSQFSTKFKAYNADKFVQLETGKGLSTNDYTDDEKTKLGKSLTTDDFEDTPIDWESEWPTE